MGKLVVGGEEVFECSGFVQAMALEGVPAPGHDVGDLLPKPGSELAKGEQTHGREFFSPYTAATICLVRKGLQGVFVHKHAVAGLGPQHGEEAPFGLQPSGYG